MDVGSLLTIVLLAAALACQPWSVVAGIVLVTSERGVGKTVAYVAGWMSALLVVAVASVLFQPTAAASKTIGTARAWVELVLGVIVFGWLLARLRGIGSRPANTAGTPRWMARVDIMRPRAAAVLGAFLPNYVLVLAAISEMLRSGQSGATLAVTAFAFVVVASLGVAAPLIVLLLRRDQAPTTYARWRAWLEQNVTVVLVVIGLLVATVLIWRGLTALL